MSERADRFTAVIDTNVLVGALARNVVLSLAEAGIFWPRWSKTTLDVEFERVFDRLYPQVPKLGPKQRENIERAFPEAKVTEDPCIIECLDLPDPDDRHVVAAAIMSKAAVIVTDNVKDFPSEALEQHEIQAVPVDEFIADCIDLGGPEAVAALKAMRERFRQPAMDAEALLTLLEERGLTETARYLAPYKSLL